MKRVLSITALAVFALASCDGTSTTPAADGDGPAGGPLPPAEGEIRIELSVSDTAAAPGDDVVFTAHAQRGIDAPAPAGFVLTLEYDADRLTPVADVSSERGRNEVRMVNLDAGPGRVKAAAAAPEELASDELFAIEMRVEAPDWIRDLDLDVRELTVVEGGIRDIAPRVETLIGPGE